MLIQKIDDAIAEYEATGYHPGEICLAMTREAFTELMTELKAYIPMPIRQRVDEPEKVFDRLLGAYRKGYDQNPRFKAAPCLYCGIEIRPAEFGEGWAIVRKK